jgi:hypothetical protein
LRTCRGEHHRLLARGAGDRGLSGVVLSSAGTVVAVGVITELAEHPGAEQVTEAGLAAVDLSVRVPATMRLDLLSEGGDLDVEGSEQRYLGAHGHR